jgi:polysaccharide export outer membrane protein
MIAASGSNTAAMSDLRAFQRHLVSLVAWGLRVQEVIVRPDGKLSFPLAGDVAAEGRTPEQVQKDITAKIERYIPDPVVTVTVKEIGGNKIYVIGQVKKPGAYVIGRYVDVVQALTLAEGLTPFAAENSIKILRR